jgi:hypothetical protein
MPAGGPEAYKAPRLTSSALQFEPQAPAASGLPLARIHPEPIDLRLQSTKTPSTTPSTAPHAP